jgi:hypothetical protein
MRFYQEKKHTQQLPICEEFSKKAPQIRKKANAPLQVDIKKSV